MTICLLKITSFWLFHIDQISVRTLLEYDPDYVDMRSFLCPSILCSGMSLIIYLVSFTFHA